MSKSRKPEKKKKTTKKALPNDRKTRNPSDEGAGIVPDKDLRDFLGCGG